MKINHSEKCDCDKPEIKKNFPKGCSLNQIIKCHGDQPIGEIFENLEIKEED
jgi:hypothetical protein